MLMALKANTRYCNVIRSFEDSFTIPLFITTAFLQLPRLRNTVFSKIALYRVQKFVFIKFALGGIFGINIDIEITSF